MTKREVYAAPSFLSAALASLPSGDLVCCRSTGASFLWGGEAVDEAAGDAPSPWSPSSPSRALEIC